MSVGRDACRCWSKAVFLQQANRSKSWSKVKVRQWSGNKEIGKTRHFSEGFWNQGTDKDHNQINKHKRQGLTCQDTRLHWAILCTDKCLSVLFIVCLIESGVCVCVRRWSPWWPCLYVTMSVGSYMLILPLIWHIKELALRPRIIL